MFFQHAFGNGIFSSLYTKNIIFGLQLGPQLGVKNLLIFTIFASRAQKTRWEPQKLPKACPGRLQDPPKTSRMSLWTSTFCIFPTPYLLKTQKITEITMFYNCFLTKNTNINRNNDIESKRL